ncbi:MAG: hypothetical protein AAGK60_12880 [Pseudomonadota bacterium]
MLRSCRLSIHAHGAGRIKPGLAGEVGDVVGGHAVGDGLKLAAYLRMGYWLARGPDFIGARKPNNFPGHRRDGRLFIGDLGPRCALLRGSH